jgi:hypothetical protein
MERYASKVARVVCCGLFLCGKIKRMGKLGGLLAGLRLVGGRDEGRSLFPIQVSVVVIII